MELNKEEVVEMLDILQRARGEVNILNELKMRAQAARTLADKLDRLRKKIDGVD